MQRLSYVDPVWMRTFPHRVTPMKDEWFPGVLLRCDEVNQWSSGTTFRYLREQAHQHRFGPRPQLIVVPPSILKSLAHLLLIAEERLLATTYHCELARLYGSPQPHGRLLSTTFTFHLCPACVAQTRLLTRTLLWPYLQYCPLHHLELQTRCQCGVALRPFSGKGSPFTCFACGMDWGDLPEHQIPPDRMEREEQLGGLYEYFLVEGTPRRMERAADTLRRQEKEASMLSWSDHPEVIPYRKKFSLGYLVGRLVQAGVSPHDFPAYW